MKCSSVFLALLLSYSVAAQSDILPPGQKTTTTTTNTPDSKPTTTTTSSPTSTSASTSPPPDSAKSSTTSTSTSSAPPSHTTTSEASSRPPSLTTVSGSEVIVTFTSSAAPSSTSSAAPAPPTTDSGLGTGSIVGLSVAGGVALIGVVAFFVWKFTRKRFSDFDDNEAIKWPDLNNHGAGIVDSHPLPVKNTGRAGFDTGSEGDLSLANNYSTPDFNQSAAPDPYAVPPLPHLNPNQPYRDDPSSYYDPYRGPVPGTIESGVPTVPEWGSEAFPMTQMGVAAAAVPGGRNSPAPQQIAYDPGRRSPGPYAVYDAYGPGPAGPPSGRMSPGPQMAYNAGSMSPAPGPRT